MIRCSGHLKLPRASTASLVPQERALLLLQHILATYQHNINTVKDINTLTYTAANEPGRCVTGPMTTSEASTPYLQPTWRGYHSSTDTYEVHNLTPWAQGVLLPCWRGLRLPACLHSTNRHDRLIRAQQYHCKPSCTINTGPERTEQTQVSSDVSGAICGYTTAVKGV